jgi:hypothetical protein
MSPNAVSVVIPTYKIIIVDDGSTDETGDLLRPLRDRIGYVALPRGGAGRARNHGIRLRHPLIAFLNSDDEWIPRCIEAKRRLMDARPEIAFCCIEFAARAQDGSTVDNSLRYRHEGPLRGDQIPGAGVNLSSLIQLPTGVQDKPVHVGNLYVFEIAASYVFTGNALHLADGLPIYEDWECDGRLGQRASCASPASETDWQHGHSGPRLTGTAAVDAGLARIAVLERSGAPIPAISRRRRGSSALFAPGSKTSRYSRYSSEDFGRRQCPGRCGRTFRTTWGSTVLRRARQ